MDDLCKMAGISCEKKHTWGLFGGNQIYNTGYLHIVHWSTFARVLIYVTCFSTFLYVWYECCAFLVLIIWLQNLPRTPWYTTILILMDIINTNGHFSISNQSCWIIELPILRGCSTLGTIKCFLSSFIDQLFTLSCLHSDFFWFH